MFCELSTLQQRVLAEPGHGGETKTRVIRLTGSKNIYIMMKNRSKEAFIRVAGKCFIIF